MGENAQSDKGEQGDCRYCAGRQHTEQDAVLRVPTGAAWGIVERLSFAEIFERSRHCRPPDAGTTLPRHWLSFSST